MTIKYRKKPVIIEAIQYNGKNRDEILIKLGMECIGHDFISFDLLIDTLEGEMRVPIFNYVIKGVKGEFYSCRPDIFDLSYEKVIE